MGNELDGLKEGLKAKTNLDLLRATQKLSNWKMPAPDGLHEYWFKN